MSGWPLGRVSSLRARLLAWLLTGVLLVGIVGGWFVYRNALAEADAFFDYQLQQTAFLVSAEPLELRVAPEMIPPDAADYDFDVQVWTLTGLHIVTPRKGLANFTGIGFSNVATREGQWRSYGLQTPTKVIQVAQPMRVRERQAAELAVETLKPFALLLPVLGVIIWLAVGHALEPLQQLTGQVQARKVNAVDPLPDSRLPEEVRPLVGALNDLLARLAVARERERAFMADAAHELRTPLTALHLQMGMLARAGNEAERADAMAKLSAGVQRAIRLVEQMLALARQEPRAEATRVAVNLEALAREVVGEIFPLADARNIDLGIPRSEPASVQGDPDALRILLRNLVDNAVRYTGPGGQVDVVIEGPGAAAPGAVLKVIDNGPGIPPEERTRIFDRFYRRSGTLPPGSGLGMAIVKAIADTHGATIALETNPAGQGLIVTVTFPLDTVLRSAVVPR